MNEKEYIRRIQKARASRDICSFLQSEEFYQNRIHFLYQVMDKLRAERDAAIKERDEALVYIGKQTILKDR